MSSSDLVVKKEHPEEVACCRVCHGESEPDNPLFYPCKCDGSIRYVHQECLVQWLKVSKQKRPKCELCGEKFHFQNVYKDGAPNRLSMFEFFLELLPRILSVSKTIVYVIFSVLFWCVCLPLFTNWWVKVCWCFVSDRDISTCSLSIMPLIDSFEHITLAWYNGVVNICVIVAISVLCFELGQILYREYDIAEKNRNIRMLERQLIDNLERLRQYEEERRQSEIRMMCLSDYQSLKNEWDAKKQESEAQFHALQAANPFLTDREMNQHLISNLRIDVDYTSRMLLRLEDISAVPQMEYFGTLKDCYQRVNGVLVKHIGTGKKKDAKGLVEEVVEEVRDELEARARENQMIQSLVADPLLHDVVMRELNETDVLTNVEGKMRFGPTSDAELDLLRTVLSEKSAPNTPKGGVASSGSAAVGVPGGGVDAAASSSSSSSSGSSSSGPVKHEAAGGGVDEFGRVIFDSTDYEARGRAMMKQYYEAEEAKKRLQQQQLSLSGNEESDAPAVAPADSSSFSSSGAAQDPENVYNSKLSGDEVSSEGKEPASEQALVPNSSSSSRGQFYVSPARAARMAATSASSPAASANSPTAPLPSPPPPRVIEINGRVFNQIQLPAEGQPPVPNNENNNNLNNPIADGANLPPVVGPDHRPNPGLGLENFFVREFGNHPPIAGLGEVNQIDLPALANAPAGAPANDGVVRDRDDFLGLRHLLVCFAYVVIFVIVVLVLPALIGRILVDSSVIPFAMRDRAKEVIAEVLEQEHIHNLLSTKLFIDYDALVAKAEAVAAAAVSGSPHAVAGAAMAGGASSTGTTESTVEGLKPIVAEMFYAKFKVLFEIGVGYGVYSSACLLLYIVYCINYARTMHVYRFPSMVDFGRAQADNLKRAIVMLTKMSLLLTVYGGVLPMGIALLVCKALAKSVGVNISMDLLRKQTVATVAPTVDVGAAAAASAAPSSAASSIFSDGLISVYDIDPVQVIFGLFLYLFAFLFMSHILCLAIELRGLIHKDLLVHFLPIKTLLDFPPMMERVQQMGVDMNRLDNINQVMNELVNNPHNVIIEHVNQDGVPIAPPNNNAGGVGAAVAAGGGGLAGAAVGAVRPIVGQPQQPHHRRLALHNRANNNNHQNGVGGAAAGAVGVDIEIRLGGNPPAGNNQIDGLQHTIAKITFSRILRKFLINAAILVPSILMSIIVPVRFGHILCPFSEPLLLRFKSTAGEVQIPIEMILSHIFLPLLLEKMKYRTNIRRLMTAFLSVMAPPLGLEWILAPDAFPLVIPPAGPPPVVVAGGGGGGAPPVDVAAPADPAVEPAAPEVVRNDQPAPLVQNLVNSGAEAAAPEEQETLELSTIEGHISSEDNSVGCPGVELSDVLSVTRSRSDSEGSSSSTSSSNAEKEWSELRSVSSASPSDNEDEIGEGEDGVDESDLIHFDDVSEMNESDHIGEPAVAEPQEDSNLPLVGENDDELTGSTIFPGMDEVEVVHPPLEQIAPVVQVDPNPDATTVAAAEVAPEAAGAAAPSPLASLPVELRIALLVLAGMLLMGVTSSWAIHFPLTVGRRSVAVVGIPPTNDIFNYPVGLIVCWGGSFVLDYILRDLVNNFNVSSLFRVTAKWSGVVGKVVLLGVIWLVVPPMAIGLLIESLFIIPLRTPLNETPQYPFLQCWAIGLILFKVWARCVLTGMFGDIPLRLQFEQILIRGFAQFDAWSAFIHVIVPVTRRLFDLLLIPFFAARTATVFIPSYLLRTLLVRFSIHLYIGLRILYYVVSHVYQYLIAVHNEVRDSRYLIGTKLTNREKQM